MTDNVAPNGNSATLVGALKVLALILAVTVPAFTLYGAQIAPLQEWKSIHQQQYHPTQGAAQRIEDKLDGLIVMDATTITKLEALTDEVVRLRQELLLHRDKE